MSPLGTLLTNSLMERLRPAVKTIASTSSWHFGHVAPTMMVRPPRCRPSAVAKIGAKRLRVFFPTFR